MLEIDPELKEYIAKYEKDTTFFNYPGTIFYASTGYKWVTDPTLAYYGAGHPYALAFIRDGNVKLELPLEIGFGEVVTRALKNDLTGYIDQCDRNVRNAKGRLDSWLKANQLDSLADLKNLRSKITEASEILIEAMKPFQAAIVVDGFFKRNIAALRETTVLSLSDEDIQILTTSDLPSPSQIHEEALLRLVKYVRTTYTDNPPPLEDFLKKGPGQTYLKDSYLLGYYLYAGYGGVKLWSLQDEYRLAIDSLNSTEELADRLKIGKSHQGKLRSALENKNLDSAAKELFAAARYFSHLRDERKELQQRFFYWQAEALEKIATLVGVTREVLEYLRYDEFALNDFDKDKISKIAQERTAYLFIWTPEKSHLRWAGAEADEAYWEYSAIAKQKQESPSTIKGQSANRGKATGLVRVIFNSLKADQFQEGSVLVTGMTSPDFVPLMKLASAIVTDLGGVTCHAAIIARELNKPCVIGTQNATRILKDGDLVEVDADRGIVTILNK